MLPSLWWGDDESAPGAQWEILGDHRPGTYADLVRVPRECVVPKPRTMSWTEAAALPLVGLTTYRALFSGDGCARASRCSCSALVARPDDGGVARRCGRL